jgi:hypothetical protein
LKCFTRWRSFTEPWLDHRTSNGKRTVSFVLSTVSNRFCAWRSLERFRRNGLLIGCWSAHWESVDQHPDEHSDWVVSQSDLTITSKQRGNHGPISLCTFSNA